MEVQDLERICIRLAACHIPEHRIAWSQPITRADIPVYRPVDRRYYVEQTLSQLWSGIGKRDRTTVKRIEIHLVEWNTVDTQIDIRRPCRLFDGRFRKRGRGIHRLPGRFDS